MIYYVPLFMRVLAILCPVIQVGLCYTRSQSSGGSLLYYVVLIMSCSEPKPLTWPAPNKHVGLERTLGLAYSTQWKT